MKPVWHELAELYRYREMLRNLMARELRARYKGSLLGFLWTLVHPLLMLVVYTLVFYHVLQIRQDNFAMFLFVGLLPWQYHVQSLTIGSTSLVQNASLLKKIYFPRSILPLATVGANLANYLLSLVVLIPALLLSGVTLTVALSAFPLVVVIQTVLVAGLTLLVAIGNVYFRDLQHLVSVLVNLWFFVTPVFYGLELVPEKLRPVFMLNPVTTLIEAYRAIFLHGRWPHWPALGAVGVVGAVLALASMAIFVRAQRRVAEEL
jgi:ABC-2 type transport system permease protein